MKDFDNNLAGAIIKAWAGFIKQEAGSLHYNITNVDQRTIR